MDWIEKNILCPLCNGEITKADNFIEYTCLQCLGNYPMYKNMFPLFIPDSTEHISKITKKSISDPSWFEIDQRDYYKNSPYADHLTRRHNFIKDIINTWKMKYRKDTGIQRFNIIDLGCGDGMYIEWLHNSIDNIYGTDYSHIRLERAYKKNNSARLILMDLRDQVFKPEFFDIIICTHVLEHIKEYKYILKKINTILHPNGIFILGLPNEGSLWWQLAYKLEPNLFEITDHVNFFKADDVKIFCESIGFEVIQTEYMGYGLPHFGADFVLKKQKGIDDFMESLGHRFFEDQASSFSMILKKKQENKNEK